MKNILVALSGGVDSAVSALLLKKMGYNVSAAYIKIWINENIEDIFSQCPWEDDIKYAKLVCAQLNINLKIITLTNDYKCEVVNSIIEGYKNGDTPNPDILCNKKIKFGKFLSYALQNGFDGIATGHYCNKIKNEDNSYDIGHAKDSNKDQSYFLSFLTQNQIRKTLFPLGSLTKEEVRNIAKKHNLVNAMKKDSQGICFLGKISINKFLKKFIKEQQGYIKNLNGEILGKHNGLHYFTIGQRKGLGIASNKDFQKYVVIEKNYITNDLVIGFDNTSKLYTKKILVKNLSFTNKKIDYITKIKGKTRYRESLTPLTFYPLKNKKAIICFEKEQRAITKGQILALYNTNKLLGGGIYA